jgi:hypothetical protein
MRSEENSLQRLQIIKQTQTGLYQEVQALVAAGTLTPTMFKKIKKPYADTLYTLGVKDCDTYLPTDEEVIEMIKQAKTQEANKQPTPADQAITAQAKSYEARANLDTVKAAQIEADVNGTAADKQLEGFALLNEHKAKSY